MSFQISKYRIMINDSSNKRKGEYLFGNAEMCYFHLISIQDAESPVFMAPLVTFSAPSPVKIVHVTYKMENVLNVNLGYMAVTVMYRVPPTVKTIRVTHRMEHVIHVNLDGQESIVKQVIISTIYEIKI